MTKYKSKIVPPAPEDLRPQFSANARCGHVRFNIASHRGGRFMRLDDIIATLSCQGQGIAGGSRGRSSVSDKGHDANWSAMVSEMLDVMKKIAALIVMGYFEKIRGRAGTRG